MGLRVAAFASIEGRTTAMARKESKVRFIATKVTKEPRVERQILGVTFDVTDRNQFLADPHHIALAPGEHPANSVGHEITNRP